MTSGPEPEKPIILTASGGGGYASGLERFLSGDRSSYPSNVSHSLERLESADPANVQQVAVSQLELLTHFYHLVLAQSRRSFLWALVGSGIGLVFFVVAVFFALTTGVTLSAVVPLLSGAIVQLVAGVVFWLYARTTSQLSNFHSRLDALQRYLLANSICEGLDGEDKNKARAELIREIARPQTAVEKGT
jgi:hypothetical protein